MKSMAMTVSLRTPWRLGSALKVGRSTIVSSGTKSASSSRSRPDQQLADEQRMPGKLGEDARLDAVFRIGAAIEILREQFLAARMRDEISYRRWKFSARACDCLPTRRAFRQLVADDELVLGGAAGMDAGLRAEGAALLDHTRLAGGDRMLIEGRRGQIPMNAGEVLEAEFIGAVAPFLTPVSCTIRLPP